MNLPANVTGQREHKTIEELVDKALSHGTLAVFGRGKEKWSASVDMYATGEGVKFSVDSGYKCKSMHDALTILCARIDKAVDEINNTRH